MKYIEFDIPDKFKDQDITEFDNKKAKEFYRWFMSIKDERIIMLESLVQTAFGFENWKADYSPKSLNVLQRWFETQIEEQTFTKEEMDIQKNVYKDTLFEKEMAKRPPVIWRLTGKTIRIAVDAGIYFSEVFLKNNASLYWGQNITSKLYIYRNYPLVKGFKGEDFTPFFIVRSNMINLHKRGEKFTWEEKYKDMLQYVKK